jgi:hypothetical protein
MSLVSFDKNATRRVRVSTCEACSTEFSYPFGTGQVRKCCSEECRHKRRNARAKTKSLCVVEGCDQPRAYATGICNACYCRVRRTGTLDRRVFPRRTLASNGYILISGQHDHPLANKSGSITEHRKILYETLGAGTHPCHWCSMPVRWQRCTVGCTKGTLVPDHLDGDKTNNHPSNLVPACNRCNAVRGLFMFWVRAHKDDPLLWQMYERSKAQAV